MDTTGSCRHIPVTTEGLEVAACGVCAEVSWFQNGRWLQPEIGVARLFGEFRLVGSLPGISAPAHDVHLYAPPSPAARSRLRAFPPKVWLQAAPNLWMSHDGNHLALAAAPGRIAAMS